MRAGMTVAPSSGAAPWYPYTGRQGTVAGARHSDDGELVCTVQFCEELVSFGKERKDDVAQQFLAGFTGTEGVLFVAERRRRRWCGGARAGLRSHELPARHRRVLKHLGRQRGRRRRCDRLNGERQPVLVQRHR